MAGGAAEEEAVGFLELVSFSNPHASESEAKNLSTSELAGSLGLVSSSNAVDALPLGSVDQ